MGEIIRTPQPHLNEEQREYWQQQATYWSEHEEITQRALEYARAQRRAALQMLGAIAVEESS